MNKAITTILVTGATITGVAGVLALNPTGSPVGIPTAPTGGSALRDLSQAAPPQPPQQDGEEGSERSEGSEGSEDGEVGEDGEDGRANGTSSATSGSASSTTSGSGTSGGTSGGTSSGTTSSTGTTYTGSAYRSPYGAMQVSIRVSDGQITDIQWEQIPLRGGHSSRINSYAAPLLVDQALQAQSASVDGVSGATYTTEGFRTSLQSAIQKAGL